MGINGVLSYTVHQRIHEIGIGMALGARWEEILRLTLGWGVKWVLGGAFLGIVASLMLTRFLASQLYNVSATDPSVLGGVALLLVVAAGLAAFLPARRASSVDPAIALRHE